MYKSTITVTSTPTQIFNTPIYGAYSLLIAEQAGNQYSGSITFQEHNSPSGTSVENVDFRGFLSCSRYLPSSFQFESSRTYYLQKSAGLFQISTTSGTDISVTFTAYAVQPHMNYQIKVGTNGDFATLKSAVDWFNSNAVDNTEIMLDGGPILITDTITVNNSSYNLKIMGSGYDITILQASTGLTGKPMFNIKTQTLIHSITATGSTLASYGTVSGENFATFNTTANIYSEFQDCGINTFYYGFADLIGTSIYLNDFQIDSCIVGIIINYTTVTGETNYIDAEIGNFDSCLTGVSLVSTGSGSGTTHEFIIMHILFYQYNTTDISVLYNGTNYVYGSISNVFNCSYNNVGTFVSGFDFTLSRDADIEISGCDGSEDKSPHAKINVVDNATTTTVTTSSTYYKANFTNGSTYSCKMGLTAGQMQYYSSHVGDMRSLIAGNVGVNNNNRNVTVAVRRNLVVATVTGTGATVTVTTTYLHNMSGTGNVVTMTGWTGGTGTWNGQYTVTITSTTAFTYTATGNGTATGGTSYSYFSPMTVRTATSGSYYPFTVVCYLERMRQNDTISLYLTSSSSGDVVTVSDLNWLAC